MNRFNLALKGEDYFLGRGLHPSLNKGFKKPLPKGRGLLYEIKSALFCFFLLLLASCVGEEAPGFSVLLENSSEVAGNNIQKAAFVSVPFSGHFKILKKMALSLADRMEIRFIITGWENVAISREDREDLARAGVEVIVVNDKPLTSSAPMSFTFPRTANNVDQVISAVSGSDIVIYDFFALEGHLAGKRLAVPAICSIPAILGPFEPENPHFQKGVAENRAAIKHLEAKFSLNILDNLEMVSDAFLLPSEIENIVWSWPGFIEAQDYCQGRRLKNIAFARPELRGRKAPHDEGQKLIYVSFGTVVTGNLWDQNVHVRGFVRGLFDELVDALGEKDEYRVIVSTGRNPKDLFERIPNNFYVDERVDQREVLQKADLFITHGGGNSVNEAIDSETPMLVIPFFGDQHLAARNIEILKIGCSFEHSAEEAERAVNTLACRFSRQSLSDPSRLSSAVRDVLGDKRYKENIVHVKAKKPLTGRNLLLRKFLFKWREGDLLFGTNADRCHFANKTGLESYFKIGDVRPFSELVSDAPHPHALPRLIDQYNDVLRHPGHRRRDQNCHLERYKNALCEFDTFLMSHPDYLEPLGDYPRRLSEDDLDSLETIWNMCLGGLDFFINVKNATIHFVIKDYDPRINKATTRELNWLRSHWSEEVRRKVAFYLFREDDIMRVDPEECDWFRWGVSACPSP
jgi:MGT family glycosyltransferase